VRVTATKDPEQYCVEVTADTPRPMMLHWAVDDWKAPKDDVLPPGTVRVRCEWAVCVGGGGGGGGGGGEGVAVAGLEGEALDQAGKAACKWS